MPVCEPKNDGPKWPMYVGIGCAGALLLFVIAIVGLFFWIRATVRGPVKTLMSNAPVKRTKPYAFGYNGTAAKVTLRLPDGSLLTYMQEIGPAGSHYGGQRALRLVFGKGAKQEWPLVQCDPAMGKVGVYWHPAKQGQGPFVRLYDDTGESLLDLKRREVGELFKDYRTYFMSDHAYNDHEFRSGYGYSKGPKTEYFSASGKPAINVTPVLSPLNCRYLGSVVRKGNGLIFVPSKP